MAADAAAEKDTGEEIVDTPYKGGMTETEKKFAGNAFHFVERTLLALILAMTLVAVAGELVTIFNNRTVSLGDLLTMFLYTEVVGMVAVFYTGGTSTFVFPIFIAITAMSRLIILQGKDMKPENIVFEASAILLLTVSAVVIVRVGRS